MFIVLVSSVRLRRSLAPNAGQRGLDFLLEAGDQFAVAVDEHLLGFDFADYGLLRGEGWEGNLRLVEASNRKLRMRGTGNDCVLCAHSFDGV